MSHPVPNSINARNTSLTGFWVEGIRGNFTAWETNHPDAGPCSNTASLTLVTLHLFLRMVSGPISAAFGRPVFFMGDPSGKLNDGKRMADGRLQMADDRWRKADDGLRSMARSGVLQEL